MPEPTKEKWLQIAHDFYQTSNFPNCLGEIDGKHIRIIEPENSGSLCYNYKHYFSIVLLAVFDTQYCLTAVGIGSYGRSSDSSIFQSSASNYKLKNRLLDIPDPEPLPETLEPKVPYVFVGDEAFGLSQRMMRPYAGKSLT
jgi:hypothetical protein